MPFYEIAQYELATLRFAAKPSSSASAIIPTDKDFMEHVTSKNLRRLWYSLAAVTYLREAQMGDVEYFFEKAQSQRCSPYYEAYSSLQMAVVAAALGKLSLTEYYFDVARKINTEQSYPIQDYPYVSLLARHNRAFVHTIIDVKDGSHLGKKEIQTLKGYSHFVARLSRALRQSDSALNTLERMSRKWKKPLRKEKMRSRLKQFEQHLLDKAGTIFVG